MRKILYCLFLLLCSKMSFAHEPDISTFMIYEQNGKHLIIIKSSLTAFEGEIDYLFKKNAYKSPEEFRQLVIKHFESSCFVTANRQTLKLLNPQVILGHETTVFAELAGLPSNLEVLSVKNTMFKDMPRNMCELILMLKHLPQKQYVLNNDNQHEVRFRLSQKTWVLDHSNEHDYHKIFYAIVGILILLLLLFIYKKWAKNLYDPTE